MPDSRRIETDRLILRVPEMSDFNGFAAMWADEGVNRYISGKTFSRKESWPKFAANVGRWQLLGYGEWSVIDRASGAYLGQVGFFDADREIGADFDKDHEAGWVLTPAAHGKGVATEAMLAAHAWLDASAFAGRTVCMMDPTYAATRRVAVKCGYVDLRRVTNEMGELQLMERVV